MSLPELCIRRPVMTTLLMMSFVIFGLFGYRQLPVAALPRVDYPTIQVTTTLPGASPDTMAASVTAPLERQFATIPAITTMTSQSGRGTSSIILQFDLDRSIDGAALDVQAAITASLRKLPPTLPAPPTFRKVNPSDFAILIIALRSNELPLYVTDDYAEQNFAQQISQIPGVAQAVIFGQQKFAVRVQVDPEKAAARGLTIDEVAKQVAAANSSAPLGVQLGQRQNVTIEATGQMSKAEAYRSLTVAWRNGAPVRLDEIGSARNSVDNDQVAAWFNDDRAILLGIYRQSDANTVDVVDQIKANLPRYAAQLPASVHVEVINDRSKSIRDSVHDVQETLGIAIVLVILVIFLFLKTLSATLIPALALPVSLIGTFAVMFLFGYSIDNISLLAITLSVGFVVDDAIVMLENIVRHIEGGMKPFEAALKGAREIGFTILSITFSLVAVFIPVLFMGGVVGRIFREFAVTISVAILVSGFVSLTLTPMLCARILSPIDHHKRPGAFSRAVDAVIDGALAGYRYTLDIVLRWKRATLLVTLASFVASGVMYYYIPKGFFPTEDTGYIVGSTEAAPDVSIDAMNALQMRMMKIVQADPAVDYLASVVGFGGIVNQGRIFVALKDKAARGDQMNVISRLRKSTGGIPGMTVSFVPVQNFNFSGRITRSNYQYTLQSSDLGALYASADKMMSGMALLPGLHDVTTDLQIRNPQSFVDIDRDKAAAYGITVDQVRTALYSAFGSYQASTIYTQASDYQIIVEAARDFQGDPNQLAHLYIRPANVSAGVLPTAGAPTTGPAALIPLDQIATIRRSVGPLTINRQSQQPSVTLSFNLAPGVAIGEAVDSIQKLERQIGMPASVATSFSGTAQIFQDSLKGQGPLLLAAVLTIYILLGVLYESFIHPITILSGLPSAGLGALIFLRLFGMDLSVVAIIGVLLLIGIVKKNAIMMIDFALVRRREGANAEDAIREAALIRFRPIIMTTLAAALGAVPIALGAGAGAELRQPLGIAIVGGLAVSQVLTLYITPVVYYYMDFVDSWLARGRRKAPAIAEAARPATEAAE
ncbi:MAG: efflux RND transporter permease subunit [Hyphomicrobiales bacterium]|nr:efflux RND transporter permease subunit [Hyphomicrobiales bacterium]